MPLFAPIPRICTCSIRMVEEFVGKLVMVQVSSASSAPGSVLARLLGLAKFVAGPLLRNLTRLTCIIARSTRAKWVALL